ncbi:hypothetical protein E0Z10_g10864 [Xylaria hypoxylon]|uniref:Carrier domain-containing protein n=1 Tax=Xylaria hypoxylon TaxID=37992 RepID=A0A4Z0XYV0_9PEZI|nr:hypothetical protein E0Z10_g10864 [Xylaria hypoxylon]
MPEISAHTGSSDGRSCYVGKVEEAHDPEVLRGAWLLLLSRYSGGSALEVKDTGSADTLEIAADVNMKTSVFLGQVRKTIVSETCLTSGPVHAFPLADRCLRDGNINFRTAMTHKNTDLASIEACHIAVAVRENVVSISVDESLSSSNYDRDLPKRLVGQFQTTAAQLQNAARDSTIGMINFMSPADWDDAAMHESPFPLINRKTLHSMMYENSLPDSLAIDAWDGMLTYAELDHWSNIVAQKLRHAGVSRGTYVPLFFEKSLWHPVSIFACSKIGAPWVTIPFDMPSGRAWSIINQLKDKRGQTSRVCLSSNAQRKKAASYIQDVIEVTLDTVCAKASDFRNSDTIYTRDDADTGSQGSPPTDPDDCAYVIFTSGTTGSPKGIAISQENICTFIPAWINLRGYPGGVGIREGHILPYTGDMSVLEIVISLCTGSCLCILSEDERVDDLGPALARYNVTNLHTTPSISEILDPKEVPSLQHIHFGGEWTTRALMERWLPTVDVLITYGPAEITNECSGLRVLSSTNFGNGCIGKPFGSRMYIVAPENPHRRLPRGFVGEIVVEGPGVSAGYVASSQQEASAFIEGIAWATAVDGKVRRFYRTGDLGYMDADGLFFCQGRQDLQVKMRGQRIELAELEHLISTATPKGTRVVVDAVMLRTGAQNLVAFLQLGEASVNQDVLIESLKDHLLTHLLPSFVPSSFIFVDHIPLGATGKADRKMLRTIGQTGPTKPLHNGTSTPGPSAQNGINAHVETGEPGLEETLRALWASVLHLELDKIQPDSHFFSLGGDSITAMKLGSLARKQSITLSFTQIYRTPTLGALVAALQRSLRRSSTVIPVSKTDAERPAVAPFPTKPSQTYEQKESPSLLNGDVSKHASSPISGDQASSELKRLRETMLENPINGLVESEYKKTVNGVSTSLREARHINSRSKHDIADLWNIDAESIEDISDATPTQETFFTLSHDIPGVQILQWEIKIPDTVSTQRICNSWRRVVDRNPILRTRFFQSPTALLQVVLADDFHWELQPEAISDAARLRLRQDMIKNDGHLSDFVIFCAPNENVQTLVWTVHRALVDDYAARLMMKAAQKGYKGHVIPHMETLTAFFSSSQANTSIADEAVTYWKEVLRGCQSAWLPGIPRLRDGVHVSTGLDKTMRKLHNITIGQHSGTPILRAAWALTIAKMTKTDDVLFGAIVSGRADARSSNVAGSLSNIVPVRTKVNLAVPVDEFLKQVRQEMAAMTPFERTSISNIANIDPDLQRACQFQSILSVQVSQDGVDGPSDLNWMKPADNPFWGSPQTLAIDCFVKPHEVELAARYDNSINEEVISDVLTCFAEIVQALVSPFSGTILRDVLQKTPASDTVADCVEAQLRSCLSPDEDCAVCTLRSQKTPDILVAFLKVDEDITESDFSSKVTLLRNQLKKKLPAHEIPSAFYRMPTAPDVEEQSGHLTAEAASPVFPEWVLGQLNVDAKLIQDVSTATPFQTEIVGGMFQKPGAGTFVRRYPIMPEMDVDRLSKAWDLVCARLPCMRARVIFGPEPQSARLVTLSTWAKMDINSYESPADAEAGINNIRIEAGSICRALARAAVVHIAGHQSVFIYAMNHTIYDRVSLDVVWDALCDAYWSGQVAQTLLPYRHLADHLDSIDPEPARIFWRSYLEGAPVTVFPTNPTPDYIARPASSQGRMIPLVREGGSPITTGTLARAAWGLTIGSYTGSADVVFRGILSGRTVGVDDIEHASGPTLTNVPIRIRIADQSMAVPSFLAKIQEDSADIVEHETLGLGAIMGLSPEADRVCTTFNNMLIVHPTEEASGSRAMPLGEESRMMDLTGYVALTLTCSLSATMAVASTIHDRNVLDDVAAQGVLARFNDFFIALADADRNFDLTIRGLLISLSERSQSPYAWELSSL